MLPTAGQCAKHAQHGPHAPCKKGKAESGHVRLPVSASSWAVGLHPQGEDGFDRIFGQLTLAP